jgi:uncharacterized iron-regulated membrane protein
VALLRALHRWLGLALAVIVFSVAVSGALLLFRDPYYRAVYPALGAPMTAMSDTRADVLRTIESRWRDEGVRVVKFPRPGTNVFHVWLGDGTEAFVHPRDGAVIDRWRWHSRLPAFLFELHAHLLGDRAATVVNGIAALLVAFMALTGVVFWWPARRGAFRLRAAVPRRTTPGDLLRSHAAVGALAVLPVLLFAVTGAAIVFYDPAAAAMGRLFDRRPAEEPTARVAPRDAPSQPWEAVLATLDATFPEGETVFYYPGSPADARLQFRKRLPGEWHPNGRSYVLIDPYEGAVVQAIDARAQGAGTRLMHAVYPLHAAKVGGVPMVALGAFAAVALAWLGAGGAWSYAGRRLAARSAARVPRHARLGAARAATRDVLCLADLPIGCTARLRDTHLDGESRSQLRALGLTDGSVLRVCKQGEPCVVQVRTTRIGLSSGIARRVFVVPSNGRAAGEPA